jgi:hypothetical protein
MYPSLDYDEYFNLHMQSRTTFVLAVKLSPGIKIWSPESL